MDISITVDTLTAISEFVDLIADELTSEDQSAYDIMDKEISNDPVVQQSMIVIAKRVYEILGPRIDVDRMGELVEESGLSADFFDQHIANH